MPVPAVPRAEPRRTNDSPSPWHGDGVATLTQRARAVKGGAGLEIDLADLRRALL